MTIDTKSVQSVKLLKRPAAAPRRSKRRGRAPTSIELLAACRECAQTFGGGKVRFEGVDGRDVYNTTAPFRFNDRVMIAGRVEPRQTEFARSVLFWRNVERGTWEPCPDVHAFAELQDPCVTVIHGELVLGGVRFPVRRPDGRKTCQMHFHRGTDVRQMRPFLVGPLSMKDIRLIGLPDGRVGVFSRPRGAVGGRGKIGFVVVDSLDDVTAEVIESAPMWLGQFAEGEWGGANEIHCLRNGLLGVLGHVAYFDAREHRHYFAMSFAVDPTTGAASPIKIIACRDQFPAGPSKRPDLVDVIFAGGIVRNWDGTATVFVGASDAETAWLNIVDPFLEYEAWSGIP